MSVKRRIAPFFVIPNDITNYVIETSNSAGYAHCNNFVIIKI